MALRPLQEKDEYVENIIQDIGSLGLQFDTITYTSDYFPQVPPGCTARISPTECSVIGFKFLVCRNP